MRHGEWLRWTLVWRSGLRVQRDTLSSTEAKPEELTPHVMVLLAQHLARHRLREPRLLEAIAHFLVAQEGQLNSKVGLPPMLLSYHQSQPLSSLIAASCSEQPSRALCPGFSSTRHMHGSLQFSKHSACLSFTDPTPLGLQGRAPRRCSLHLFGD